VFLTTEGDDDENELAALMARIEQSPGRRSSSAARG
jgi:hypothetical protein